MKDSQRAFEKELARLLPSDQRIVILSDLDAGDCLIGVNAAFEEFLGYRRDEVIGRTTMELGLWADPGEYSEIVTQLRERGVVRDFRAQFRRKDGGAVTGLISVEVIDFNQRKCVIGTTVDITERKNWTRRCRERKRTARQSSMKFCVRK